MKAGRVKLFHDKYRQVQYVPETKTLIVHWYGSIPDEEQLKHFEWMTELLKIYEIHHLEVFVRKARFLSLRPTRIFIETVLKQLYMKGAQTLTIFQRPMENEEFVKKAYRNAIEALGINMRMRLVTA